MLTPGTTLSPLGLLLLGTGASLLEGSSAFSSKSCAPPSILLSAPPAILLVLPEGLVFWGRAGPPALLSSSRRSMPSSPGSLSSSSSLPSVGATLLFLPPIFFSGTISCVASLSFCTFTFSLCSLEAASFFLISSLSFSRFLRSFSRLSAFLSLDFFFFFLSFTPASSFCLLSMYRVRQSTARPLMSLCMALNFLRMRFMAYRSIAAFLTLRLYSRYAKKHRNRKPNMVPRMMSQGVGER
mmetsp:Transcript_9671/g.21445  ORF Transcript_9671/g.21445 Transcript_9671/m.21445 type:complete len:240 (-) Transcript_9671:2879-3598(-)